MRENHRARALGFGAVLLAVGLQLHALAAPPLALLGLLLLCLVYPWLTHLHCKHAQRPDLAERRNLALDALLLGGLLGALGFPLWISYWWACGLPLMSALFGGVRAGLKSFSLMLAGALGGVLVFGWRFQPETGPWVTGIAMTALLLSLLRMANIGLTSIRKARIARRRLLRANDRLERARAAAEDALARLREAQAQLVQSEKLASLGQLVAHVSHEINSPIGAIKSSAQSMAASLPALLPSLVPLLRGLDELELAALSGLLTLLRAGTPVESSRAERSRQRALEQQLVQLSLPPAAAPLLAPLGIEPLRLPELVPLLRHAQALPLLRQVQQLALVAQGAQTIENAVQGLARIVFALRSFSPPDGGPLVSEIDLAATIEPVLTLYRSRFDTGIELRTVWSDRPAVLADASELSQVWHNLVHNALQAMGRQGVLTIHLRTHAGLASVEISDTGCGMGAEVLAQLFTPFFSTRAPGEGSGLGLVAVRGILERHQGRIDVQSQAGQGSRFTVSLPLAPRALAGPD